MSTAHRFAAIAVACITGAAPPRPARAQQAPPAPSSEPAAPSSAPAALSTEPAAPPASRAERWYGWQILLVDLAGLGAMTAGGVPLARTNSGVGAGFFYGGAVFHNFSGPAVHLFHRGGDDDGTWKLALSYATRVLVPAFSLLAGYGIGAEAARCIPREGCPGGMIAGWIAGAYAASIIDAAAIAWEKPPAKPAAARAPVTRAAPSFSPVAGGFVAGLSGVF